MLMTTKCICKNWILKTLDPEKAFILFDRVNSSCNCIRELVTLAPIMTLPITFFLLSLFQYTQAKLEKTLNFNMIIEKRFLKSC